MDKHFNENYLVENYNKLDLNPLGFVNGFNKEQIFEGLGLVDGDYLGLIKNSKPVKEDFIRISNVIFSTDTIFNFKLQTKTQSGYIHICPALGCIDDLWEFLENLCKGEEIVLFISMLEGPNQLLFAQDVDDENIRLTLISSGWFEHFWNDEKLTIEMNQRKFDDRKAHINFDVIINKKHFIYTFYNNLAESLYGLKIPYVTSDDYAKTDSKIIKKYLGYTKPKKKDLKLKELLENGGDIKEIEKCLKSGANPNAIFDIDNIGYKETIFENFVPDYIEELFYKKLDENGYKELEDDEAKDKLEQDFSWYKRELQSKVLKITQLLYDYGAMPTSIPFGAVYCFDDEMTLIKFMLEKGTRFDDDLIGHVSTDATYGCDGYQDNYFQDIIDLYYKYLFEVSKYYESIDEVIINYLDN